MLYLVLTVGEIHNQALKVNGQKFYSNLNSIIKIGERNIIPDPDKAPKVIDCFIYASTGMHTLHGLWEYAEKIGLRSRNGSKLGKQTIVEMLQRRAYTGVFKYGGEE